MRGRRNAERNAMNLMRLQTHGGMLRKRTKEVTQLVRTQSASVGRYADNSSVVAIQALSQTITFLTKDGRFRQAADREKEIGQIYLQEMSDLRKACESFERAGDWYLQEDATAYVAVRSDFLCINGQ